MSNGLDEIKSISVLSTRTVLNVVYYEIETVFNSGRRSVVLSRFREFDELNKRIRADYKLKYKHLIDNLPEFPTKSALPFLEKKNDAFINQRKEQLQTYLQKLAKLPHALENKDFVDFINRSVNESNEYDKVYTLNPEKKDANSATSEPNSPSSTNSSSSSSTSSSSTTSSASATVSVGSTTSPHGTVFLSAGFSAGTHPEFNTASAKSLSSRPALPKSSPPTEPVKTESKEEEKPAAPASPSAKESAKYKAVEPAKAAPESSMLGSLKSSFGSFFGKKNAKPNVEGSVTNDNL